MSISIKATVKKEFNYALAINHTPFFKQITLKNNDRTDYRDLTLKITSTPSFFAPYEEHMEHFQGGAQMELMPLVQYDAGNVRNITDQVKAVVSICILQNGQVLKEKQCETTLYPMEEISNFKDDILATAAFVTPNHMVIRKLVAKMAELIPGKSICGYLHGKEEVLLQIKAAFQVAQAEEIPYVVGKPGNHPGFQRLQTADSIWNSEEAREGNCYVMTMFLASLLEGCKLHPGIIVIQDHAFVGCWLEDEFSEQPVMRDIAHFRKAVALGKFLVLESTLMRKGCGSTFEAACESAKATLEKDQKEFYVLDISRARKSGVTPVPEKITDETPVMKSDKLTGKITLAGYKMPEQRAVKEFQVPERYTRWEESLLDLAASSALTNIPLGKGEKAIPVMTVKGSANHMYNSVKSGHRYHLVGKPADFEGGRSQELFKLYQKMDGLEMVLQAGFSNQKLYFPVSEDAKKKTMVSLMRKSEDIQRERGAHALYLSFGSLRVVNPEKKRKVSYVPILLVPVEMEKEGKEITLFYNKNEVIFNEAILLLLRKHYDIKHPAGLNPVEKLSDGSPDFASILECLRKATLTEEHINVYEDHVCLGLFDFSTYDMWKDLHENREEYAAHPLVRAILDGCVPEESVPDTQVKLDDLLLPLCLDGSQLQAVLHAAQKRSFQLYGPPGTGKSQTIVAILLNLVMSRTCLFTAEKRAALQVVYERLKNLGLEQFFLYIPEGSITKESFLGQLKRVLCNAENFQEKPKEAFGKDSTAGYLSLEENNEALKAEIQENTRMLHAVRICGMTLYEMMSEYIRYSAYYQDNLVLEEKFVETLNEKGIGIFENAISQLVEAGKGIGHPANNCYTKWPSFTYQMNMAKQLHDLFETYVQYLTELDVNASKLTGEMGVEYHGTLNQICALFPKAQDRKKALAGHLPQELFKYRYPLEVLRAWLTEQSYQRSREKLLEKCDEKLLSLEPAALKRFREQWILAEGFEKKRVRKSLEAYLKNKDADEREITQLLGDLCRFVERKVPRHIKLNVQMTVEQLYHLTEALQKEFGDSEKLRAFMAEVQEEVKFSKEKEALREYYKKMEACIEDIHSLVPGLMETIKTQTLEEMAGEVNLWIENLGQIREFENYQNVRSFCEKMGLAPFVKLYEEGLSHEKMLPTFRSVIYMALIKRTYYREEDVRRFSGYRFENLVEKFKESTEKLIKATAKEIYHRKMTYIVSQLKENPAVRQEIIAFNKLAESNGAKTTVREMIAKYIPNLVKLLTPCIMLSPAAAAKYLDNKIKFDAAIYDEASQIKSAHAIGTIARASQIIICGDPLQMPPTSFFETTVDFQEVDVLDEDQESILDEAIVLNMPKHYLKMHYRSTCESLITFSNAKYYHGDLITFPSSDSRSSKVLMHKVNGIYDRGASRTNEVEANAIVDFLEKRLCDGERKSVGIIAFHVNQQALILKLMDKRSKENPAFEEALKELELSGKGVFVRNLETVQGDEADMIIFSCSYGRDKNGSFGMNFGPLNKAGAHRRLNVAFSRAKEEMHIFASFGPEEMSLTASSSRGLRDFRDFLKYAEGTLTARELMAESDTTSDTDVLGMEMENKMDGFQSEICGFLEECGYSYDIAVGNSEYRVDIGVVDPMDQERYALGILLNNTRYAKNENCYDREVGCEEQLLRRGWNCLHIYVSDWLDYPQKEKERILKALKKGKTELYTEEAAVKEAS